jgi:hypothetical protein
MRDEVPVSLLDKSQWLARRGAPVSMVSCHEVGCRTGPSSSESLVAPVRALCFIALAVISIGCGNRATGGKCRASVGGGLESELAHSITNCDEYLRVRDLPETAAPIKRAAPSQSRAVGVWLA